MIGSLPLSEIIIGERFRKELGDIAKLAESIERLGLLHPVVVTDDYRLVCGRRRIEAFKYLGVEVIPVRVVDLNGLLLAERDENSERLNFTPSEAVAIGKAIEEREAPKAKQRQKEAGAEHGKKGGRGRKKNPSEKFSEGFFAPSSPAEEETTQKAAAAVGMSAPTFRKARAVVEAAEADPEAFSDIKEQMDATGKVDPAHKELQRRTKGTCQPKRKADACKLCRQHVSKISDLSNEITEAQQLLDLAGELGALAARLRQKAKETT